MDQIEKRTEAAENLLKQIAERLASLEKHLSEPAEQKEAYKPKVVVALGGNALLRRGDPLTMENQQKNVRIASQKLAAASKTIRMVLTHGNGPQVGLLALQALAYTKVAPPTLDVLGAESQGMIGYMMEQEMQRYLPGQKIAVLLTQVLVDKKDPDFQNPSKFVGPVYTHEEIVKVKQEHPDWVIKPDGKWVRRVVPSPLPQAVVPLPVIETLIENGTLVVACGGGGIPVALLPDGSYEGVEAVIDKDRCASLLAKSIKADGLVILTDGGGGVIPHFGKPDQLKEIKLCSPEHVKQWKFPAGSMGPKVDAAVAFVEQAGGWAVIGDLNDVEMIMKGEKGTRIQQGVKDIVWYN